MENSARQYVELYEQCRETIMSHSCEAMNAVREEASRVSAAAVCPAERMRSTVTLTSVR